MSPETLRDAVQCRFVDATKCYAYLQRCRWPDGMKCPACGSDRIGQIETRHLLRCKACRVQFSCRRDTIFGSSPVGLDKWFVAAWCIYHGQHHLKRIGSCELAHAIGVTQKTAWYMLYRIRAAMEVSATIHAKENVTDYTFDMFMRRIIGTRKSDVMDHIARKRES